MRLIFVLCSCLVILVATLSVANFSSAEEQSGQSAKIHLIPIEFGNFTNDGRPPNFYRLFNSENQRLCASLLLALNEPHPPARLADLDGILTNVLLGSKFTIHWTKLGRYSYRTVVDLNNDGKRDVIYKIGGSHRGYIKYGLIWTHSFPEHEQNISRDRLQEIFGLIRKDAQGNPNRDGVMIVTENTVQPALEAKLAERIRYKGQLTEIVRVDGHFYTLKAYHPIKNTEIQVLAFESKSSRDHTLICHFKSRFIIKSQ